MNIFKFKMECIACESDEVIVISDINKIHVSKSLKYQIISGYYKVILSNNLNIPTHETIEYLDYSQLIQVTATNVIAISFGFLILLNDGKLIYIIKNISSMLKLYLEISEVMINIRVGIKIEHIDCSVKFILIYFDNTLVLGAVE